MSLKALARAAALRDEGEDDAAADVAVKRRRRARHVALSSDSEDLSGALSGNQPSASSSSSAPPAAVGSTIHVAAAASAAASCAAAGVGGHPAVVQPRSVAVAETQLPKGAEAEGKATGVPVVEAVGSRSGSARSASRPRAPRGAGGRGRGRGTVPAAAVASLDGSEAVTTDGQSADGAEAASPLAAAEVERQECARVVRAARMYIRHRREKDADMELRHSALAGLSRGETLRFHASNRNRTPGQWVWDVLDERAGIAKQTVAEPTAASLDATATCPDAALSSNVSDITTAVGPPIALSPGGPRPVSSPPLLAKAQAAVAAATCASFDLDGRGIHSTTGDAAATQAEAENAAASGGRGAAAPTGVATAMSERDKGGCLGSPPAGAFKAESAFPTSASAGEEERGVQRGKKREMPSLDIGRAMQIPHDHSRSSDIFSDDLGADVLPNDRGLLPNDAYIAGQHRASLYGDAGGKEHMTSSRPVVSRADRMLHGWALPRDAGIVSAAQSAHRSVAATARGIVSERPHADGGATNSTVRRFAPKRPVLPGSKSSSATRWVPSSPAAASAASPARSQSSTPIRWGPLPECTHKNQSRPRDAGGHWICEDCGEELMFDGWRREHCDGGAFPKMLPRQSVSAAETFLLGEGGLARAEAANDLSQPVYRDMSYYHR